MLSHKVPHLLRAKESGRQKALSFAEAQVCGAMCSSGWMDASADTIRNRRRACGRTNFPRRSTVSLDSRHPESRYIMQRARSLRDRVLRAGCKEDADSM